MAATELVPTRLEDLVLARLAFGSAVRTAAALADDLRAFAPSTIDGGRWRTLVEDTAGQLERAGRLAGLQVTDDERRALAARLGLRGTKPWKAIRSAVLPRLALAPGGDVAGLDKLDGRGDWAAAIVARATGLWQQGKPPRFAAVCDALVWRALHLAGKAKRTPPEIRSFFLVQLLSTGAGPPERLLPMLAARELGATRADLAALRDALVRRWLAGAAWDAAPDAPAPDPIDAFAAAVRDSANRATEGVFGERKVFISSLWQGMRARPPVSGMTLDEFKQQLVRAHRAGLVELARADLTAAMDPGVLRESETSHLEARYHFVERGGLS